MTAAFDVCASCRRLIKAHESACPFCSARNAHVRSGRSLLVPRMSRGAWAAVSSALVVVGCSSTKEPAAVEDTGFENDSAVADSFLFDTVSPDTSLDTALDTAPDTAPDTSLDTSLDAAKLDSSTDTADTAKSPSYDAASDATRNEVDALVCPVADVNHFKCGGVNCECDAFSAPGPWTCRRADGSDATAACFACLTCACTFWSSVCTPMDGGDGVAAVHSSACYGSPPARLEWLVS